MSEPRLPKGFKLRPHHNNTGARQIANDRPYQQVRQIADDLGIPYVTRRKKENEELRRAGVIQKRLAAIAAIWHDGEAEPSNEAS